MPRPKGTKLTQDQRDAISAKRRASKPKVEIEFTPTTPLTKTQWIAALLADRAAAEASTGK